MPDRPHLPMDLERSVKMEAGHRCAIPTCRQHPIEIAHIDQRRGDESKDVFENLIALCPNCHTRYDGHKDIDRKSMLQYKASLSILNSRYGDLERRVLEAFARGNVWTSGDRTMLALPGGLSILLHYLYEDGYLRLIPASELGLPMIEMLGVPSQEYVELTPTGKEFLTRWIDARDLDAPSADDQPGNNSA